MQGRARRHRLQDAVAAVPVSEVEQNLLARFPKPATPFAPNAAAERSSLANFMKEVLGYKPTYHPIHSKRRAAPPGDQLLRFSCSMSTMPVRGMAAVQSERVTCVHVQLSLCRCVSVYVRLCTCVCVYVCMCVCTFACMHVCM